LENDALPICRWQRFGQYAVSTFRIYEVHFSPLLKMAVASSSEKLANTNQHGIISQKAIQA
jgi:hypothetical protein